MPWRAAKTRACSRECTPSLWRMFTMWVRSVSTVTLNRSAISRLSSPSARAWSTSFSLGVSLSTASTISLMGVDLCSTPEAPASTARAKRPGSRLALRTSANVRDERSSSRSSPSPSGRARSTMATSTSSSNPPSSARVSATEPTCATTSNPGSLSSMKARAWRNETWSSTSSIPIRWSSLGWSSMTAFLSRLCSNRGLCRRRAFVARARLPAPVGERPAYVPRDESREGGLEADARPAAGGALDHELPAELAGPVPHGLLAQPDPWCARDEPASVVGDLHAGQAAVEAQPHLDQARLSVAARVGERLLDYAHDLPAGPLREGAREPFVHDQPQLVPAAGHAAVQVGLHLEGGDPRA